VNKRIVAIGLSLSLLAAQTSVYAAETVFPDLPADNMSHTAVSYLHSREIIEGYDDGTFRPDNPINRAEALKIVFLVRKELSLPDAAFSQPFSFPDVPKDEWYFDSVEEAYNLGIVEGYVDGDFKPANEITAAESVKIIYTGLVPDLELPEVKEKPFTDASIDEWFAPYLEYGKEKKYIEAFGDGSFDPHRSMTRAKFSEAIYRVMYSELNNLEEFPLSLDWRSCNNYQLGYKIKVPDTWDVLSAGDQQIFWKKDVDNRQVSFARLYPNSAVAMVAIEENEYELSLEEYLGLLEYGEGASTQTLTLNGLLYATVYINDTGLQDSYFQLPDGKILVLYTQVGEGPLGPQLKEEIRYMLGSVRTSDSPDDGEGCLNLNITNSDSSVQTTPLDQKKATILGYVLEEGDANNALQLLNDALLFETDTIGIGTGPVDYYYSAELDLTLKIDRDSDTLLATKEGKTSSF
jgi:S-layer homology domain